MDEKQYIQNELVRLYHELPKKTHKDDLKEISAILKHGSVVSHIVRAAQHIVDGNFGAGAYYRIRQASKRCNRNALLFQLVLGIEYRVDMAKANKLWHTLEPWVQSDINHAFENILIEMEQ